MVPVIPVFLLDDAKVVVLENLIEAFPGSDSLPVVFRITGKADDPRLAQKATAIQKTSAIYDQG